MHNFYQYIIHILDKSPNRDLSSSRTLYMNNLNSKNYVTNAKHAKAKDARLKLVASKKFLKSDQVHFKETLENFFLSA